MDFKPTKLFIKYAFPNMISTAFISFYFTVDTIFVGQMIGTKALGAMGLTMPFIMISFALIDMIAVGSSVQIALRLGSGRFKQACGIFSFSLMSVFIFSCFLFLFGIFFIETITNYLIYDKELVVLASQYTKVFALFCPVIMLCFMLDNYLRICKKPMYSMCVNIFVAFVNVVLDYIFIVVLGWGLFSAALATCIGLSLGTLLGFAPFVFGNLELKISKAFINLKIIKNIIYNGSSEFLTNISTSLFVIVANALLLDIAGVQGVAILEVIFAINSLMASLIFSMCDGISPLVTYYYGAKNLKFVMALFWRTFIGSMMLGVIIMSIVFFGGDLMISFFSRDSDFITASKEALIIFSPIYLCSWFIVFANSFFTALNKPACSLAISLSANLLLPLPFLFALSSFFNVNGVWLTPFAANFCAVWLAVYFLKKTIKGLN
ncbi:MAG: MATE family efflux transporter [Campylobacter hyointestinalis]